MEELQYLSHLLADNFKHPCRRTDPPRGFVQEEPEGTTIGVSQPGERAAVAVGSLLLLLLEQRGGTSLDRAALLRLARDSLHTFTGSGKAQILDEVTRVMDWLADALLDKSESIDPQSWGDVHYEVGPYLPVVRQAIASGEDLEIEYFSYHRAEWNFRRVTPTRLEGRSTLVGHCHLRGKERRFRLSRIRSLQLAQGSPGDDLGDDGGRGRGREK